MMRIADVDVELVPVGPNTRAVFRRSRVRDAVHTLYRAGRASDAQWLACCRWRDDAEAMLGVRDLDPYVQVTCSGRSGWGVSDAMLAAAERCEAGWAAVGVDPADRLLCRWCVFSTGTLADYERDQRQRHGSATPRLLAILDRLADCYARLGG
jgi:hypothetical protein